MSGLNFLKNIKVQSNSAVKTPVARTASAEAKNPTNADLRVYKNGSVFPSASLVVNLGLQYTSKAPVDEAGKVIAGHDYGNGFDVFSSGDFLNTKANADKCIFIALVPKNAGKVDLFSSTKYNEDGTPSADVLTQGAATFGAELLETIKDVYGIEIPEGKNYIDLVIVNDAPFTTDDNIYFVPKKVSRGDKKGQVDLTRREDLTLYPLVPIQLMEGGEDPANADNGSLDSDKAPQTGNLEPTLAEIEAENDGTISPAATLPEGTLEDAPEDLGADIDGSGFQLEGDIEDAPAGEEDDDETLTV